HLHAKGDAGQLGFGESLIYSPLNLRSLPLVFPGGLEVGIQINPDQSLVFQAIGRKMVPCGPDTVPGIGFERAVVNLLRKSDGGFYDHRRTFQNASHKTSTASDGYRVSDGKSNRAPTHELRDRD